MKVAATALVEFLRSSNLLKSLPCRIEPLRLVGQGSLEDDCLTEAQQKEVLNSFRKGELTVACLDDLPVKRNRQTTCKEI